MTPNIVEMDILHPQLAKSAQPGQFLIVIAASQGERIPLTVCDVDIEKGLVTIVFQIVGASTQAMSQYEIGDAFADMVGPLGQASELLSIPIATLRTKKILFIAGGVGTAPVYPQVKWMHRHNVDVDVIIGSASKQTLIYTAKMGLVAKNLYIATDDGSEGYKGFVTNVLQNLIEQQHVHYDIVVAIGPMIMMKNIATLTKTHNIPTIVSLNSLMVDGTGMCGACRVTVNGKIKFTCVDGPEFDGFQIDYDEAMKRQAMYANVEKRILLENQEKEEHHICHIGGVSFEQVNRLHKVPTRECPIEHRIHSFEEVTLGYNDEEAIREAQRCLQCKNPQCKTGCPVEIDIPAFVAHIAEGNFTAAIQKISEASLLPAICGRVCPQETQCEGRCVLGKKGDAVSIGKLERFVADYAKENKTHSHTPIFFNNHKIAVIGSGPAGLTCAADLAKMGYKVTIFEALHRAGGVLTYGIPEFRLPKQSVVEPEIEKLKSLGVDIQTNVVIGKTYSIQSLLEEEGFEAIFIGVGAGLPNFMNIKGENLNGVVSANEFLTRNNLMKAYNPHYLTPNYVGKDIAVIGGGNVAMDAARTALRLGAKVSVFYRRSETELPARREEVCHAKEEGIDFHFLTTPVEFIGENNWIKTIQFRKMQLGEPDESGRRKPIEIEGSDYSIDKDMVIMALGTSPNPLIGKTTEGLSLNKKGCIVIDEHGQTSKQGVFAGGDATSGAATVILAMGAGRTAAKAIDNYIKNK